jgi:hypothetical protein
MATFNKFNAFVADLANSKHNLSTNTLKFMLTNTAPVATNAVKTDITEIAAGNGYTAGGTAVAITSSAQVAGLYSLVPTADVVITAAGGSIGPFRYVVLYNDTGGTKPLISWYDYGSSITLLNTEALTIDVQATLLTLQ